MSARDEVRAAGLACPSCGVNIADMEPLGSHRLVLVMDGQPPYAECRDGQPAALEDFAVFRAAACVALINDMRYEETRALRAMGLPA